MTAVDECYEFRATIIVGYMTPARTGSEPASEMTRSGTEIGVRES
jgi:hypothetical protein